MPTENRSSIAGAPFKREDRYIVIKRSDLEKVPVNYHSALIDPMFSLLSHLPRRECLVIESDWPEYEPTWAAIKARVTGQPAEQHQGEPVADTEQWYADTPDGDSALVIRVAACANPGEVERLRNCLRTEVEAGDSWKREAQELRAQLEAEKQQHAQVLELATRRWGVIAKQDAKLAERDALLREAMKRINVNQNHEFVLAIEAALSASAEPSAPTFADAIKNPPEWVGKHLASKAEPSAPAELGPWLPLSAPGQIQEGDWLCFTVSGSLICAQARLIICPGTDKEEIVYNRKKNHYFCTDMAIAGTSNHKGVLVARAALERQPS